MKKSTIIIIAAFALLSGLVGYFYLNFSGKAEADEQEILGKTLDISKEYVALRYQTDNILVNAEAYPDYVSWNKEISVIIDRWEAFEKDAAELERAAGKMAGEGVSFGIPAAYAYDKKEISDIFDKAPAGKKIATLAKHLGVDAKTAFRILKQDQAQVEADAWNEAGDTFQKLETSAVVLKDTCKVIGYVGTIAATGGTAALASASTLSQAAVIISGADLTLEVTGDAARISFGNHNKISAVMDTTRIVTEPLASILSISSVPENLKTGFDKFNAVMLGIDQLNSAVQDGKIAGISLPAYTKDQVKRPITVSVLGEDDVEQWLKEHGAQDEVNVEEVKGFLKNLAEQAKLPAVQVISETKEVAAVPEAEDEGRPVVGGKDSAVGIWEGTMVWTASSDEQQKSDTVIMEFRPDKTIGKVKGDWDAGSWEQKGDVFKIFGEEDSTMGYYEFLLDGDTMTFVKAAGPDQEDPSKWAEVYAGSDFFGGKFLEITLKRQ